MLSRRSFINGLAACSVASVMGAASTLMSGCSSHDVFARVPATLEDKRVKPEDDKSHMQDEPSVDMRILATQAFMSVIPAIQENYHAEHDNVTFAEPVFVDSNKIDRALAEGEFDCVFADLAGPVFRALEAGDIDDNTRLTFYSGRVCLIGSKDVEEAIDSGASVEDAGIERIVVGNPETVFSGAYANQLLYRNGLYTSQNGKGGTYDASIAGMVSQADSLQGILDQVATSAHTAAFIMSAEAKAFGARVLYEAQRNLVNLVFYQGAATTRGRNRMLGARFVDYCANETEAQKIADSFGMPRE